MNNTIKQKYSPCELSVVEFKVERGFAASDGLSGSTRTEYDEMHTEYSTTTFLMTIGNGQKDFKNQQYGDGGNLGDWNINI